MLVVWHARQQHGCCTTGQHCTDGVTQGKQNSLILVATAAGGVGEILVDGRTGLLVPPGNAAAIAAAVQALRDDAPRAAAIAAAGSAHARATFSLGAMMQGVRAVFDEVAG